MGAHIHPERWSNWSGTQRDQTAYYAEYGNTGPGSSLNQKVGWSHTLTKKQAAKYTRENILKAAFPHEPALQEWLSGE
jgi:pectinesterase